MQPRPAGLCDALFRAAPLIPADEMVVIGLPDTVWFPEDGLCALGDETLNFCFSRWSGRSFSTPS